MITILITNLRLLSNFTGEGTEGGLLIKLAGGITGLGISQNIKDLCKFLINNYESEDFVYCFGFSLGSYTVRSLSGLLDKFGLLKKDFSNKIKEAYRLYKKEICQLTVLELSSLEINIVLNVKFIFLEFGIRLDLWVCQSPVFVY